MPTIKVTINELHKIKVKVASKKLADIHLRCPEKFVLDTVTLFKNPELTNLTETNVDYLFRLCEEHKTVLNIKPIFLKRMSNLRSEIASVETKEKSDEASRGTDIGYPRHIVTSADDVKQDITSNKTGLPTNPVINNIHQQSTAASTANQETVNTTRTININQETVNTTHTINISTEEDTTLRIKETRIRTVEGVESSFTQDPVLFVKIISPKHRIKTRYSSYSLPVVMSPALQCAVDPLRMP